MTLSHVVIDPDGTLADTVGALIDAHNALVDAHNDLVSRVAPDDASVPPNVARDRAAAAAAGKTPEKTPLDKLIDDRPPKLDSPDDG